MSFTDILRELPKLTESERQELREWLEGYDPAIESEWTRIAMERIRQLDAGLAPLDGDQVLEEMRRLAKQLAHGELADPSRGPNRISRGRTFLRNRS
jgi:hypothetical protein